MSRLKRDNRSLKKGLRSPNLLRKIAIFSVLFACFVAGGTLYWYRMEISRFGTHLYRQFVKFTADADMTIDNVFISGHSKVSSTQIRSCLGLPLHAPMLLFDMHKTYKCLHALPWVHTATLERHWPNTLYVTLTERKPFALWQHGKRIHLVDQWGSIIREKNLKAYMYLPSITGAHAPKHLPKILEALEAFPALKKRVVSATWIGNRRWNIHLDNKITLMLPEKNIRHALKRFRKYEQTHQITKGAKARIDLRIPQRIIIE